MTGRILVMASLAVIGCGSNESAGSKRGATAPTQELAHGANDWPFEDPEDIAVITLARIVDGSEPILYVIHDEDGDWQFLDGGEVTEEDAATVSLKRVAQLDPSIKLLSDLPLGWAAERAAVGSPWERFQR